MDKMIAAVLIPLTILLPVIGGVLVIPLHFHRDRAREIYLETIVLLTSVLAWICLICVRNEPITVYSFTSGFSISFSVDGLGSLFAGMISLMWPLVMLYAFSYMREEKRKNGFFAFYVMTYGAALGIALAADMITMYVFYEMLTLVTIPLVSYYGDHDSMYAGRKYAAYTIGGAALALFPVILTTLNSAGGTFRFGGALMAGYSVPVMRAAFVFGFFGFGAKAAVFPLYSWLPTASVAPTPVTALLHAVAVVNAGAFAVMRMTYYVFGTELMRGSREQYICLFFAVFSLLFGAVMALKERHFKRRLAYSTMSNLSYMLLGAMLMTPMGFQGGMAHMLFHGVIKMSLFLCAGAFMHKTGKSYIYEVNGIGRRMPLTFVCYTLGALSLTGIPLFCGFVSKWQLLMAGADEGSFAGLFGSIALVISAFLCAMYTLTISVRAFFPASAKDMYSGQARDEADLLMLLPIVIFTAVNVGLGIFPGGVMGLIGSIAGGAL